MEPRSFSVIGGKLVAEILDSRHADIVELIRQTYLAHGAGKTLNPPSYFLRFPDRPADRIIALPASLRAGSAVNGIKWISSYPENRARGLSRASAVLILNDPETGYPFACLESSIISATRTAASAVLAADAITRRSPERPRRIGVFGAGLIARYIYDYFVGTGWEFDSVHVHDRDPAYASAFMDMLGGRAETVVHEDPESLIRAADLVVFATTAGTPHVTEPDWFDHHPVVLHVSLRDLAPEVILASSNLLDDVEHCLKANTSPHLAEQQSGGRSFIDGTLYDVLTDALAVPCDRTVVFSPFGLGVLDLAVGKFVHDLATREGLLLPEPDFFVGGR
jgi:ornithine cyclodeaminase